MTCIFLSLFNLTIFQCCKCYTIHHYFFVFFYEKAATMVIPDGYEDFTSHEESDKTQN